jgi:hypothetical protein
MVGDGSRETLPRQLGEIHILPAEGVFALERDLDALIRVLETDRAWLKQASRLQDRATEWISRGRTSALLLSRGALSEAERWKEARPAKAPAPAQEILDLLLHSRQAATRRLRWWVGGSLTVAAAAIGLSIVAYLQSIEAVRQKDVAEKRSAMLAGNVARGLTKEGDLDGALLLLLQGSRWFDNDSAPDEYRIALTRILEKKSRIEVARLFENMQVFETDAALIIVNPKNNDILALTESLSPIRLVAGSPSDSAVLAVGPGTSPDQVLVVREDRSVHVLDIRGGAAKNVASLPGSSSSGRFDASIPSPGLVILENYLTGSTIVETIQIWDETSGSLLAAKPPPLMPEHYLYLKHPDGTIHAIGVTDFNRTTRVLSLRQSGTATTWQSEQVDDNFLERLNVQKCDMTDLATFRPAILERIRRALAGTRGRYSCKKHGGELLLTTRSCGNLGCERKDQVFGIPEKIDPRKTADLKETVSSLAPERISLDNLTWTGLGNSAGLFGALSSRDAFVIDRNNLLLDFRHQTLPKAARFVGSERDRLLVVEPESGQVVSHSFKAEHARLGVLSSTAKQALGEGRHESFAKLHKYACYGNPPISLPDGRRLSFRTTNVDQRQNVFLAVADKTSQREFDLGKIPCPVFSQNRKLMLLEITGKVHIYDVDKVLDSGKLPGAELGEIQGPVGSVYFVGSSHGIVTTNRGNATNRVLLWTKVAGTQQWLSTALYEGNNPVIHAEPDATGGLLLLTEQGATSYSVSLYSTKANETWLHLWSEAGRATPAIFTDQQDIIIDKGSEGRQAWAVPSFSDLVELGKKALSPWCRPPQEGEWRSSRCWPTSYK